MIRSIKAKSSRRLLLLLISFAMFLFLAACGGTLDDGTKVAGEGSVSASASISSLAAGESSILTATVTDSEGSAAKGQAVAFSFISNNSGATITSLNGGITDSTGQALATYTAGSNNSASAVQDNIQVSVTGSSRALTITRVSSSTALTGLRLSLTAASTSLSAGDSTIVTAKVTDASGNAVSGQAVTLTLLTNSSGATLTILNLGVTDTSGQALAIYKAGATDPTASVKDTLQASVTGATGVLMITRTSNTGSSSVVKMSLIADSTSLPAGSSTIVRATVTSGSGAAVAGTTVAFSLASNNSGATLVALNGGVTDASGLATATYTAGSNSPTNAVQDIIQASVTGATQAVIITRTTSPGTSTGGLTLTFSAALANLAAGESTVLTATVNNSSGAVAGETVTFSFVSNPNSSVLSSYTVTTDGSGQATTVYTAGSATASTAQDVVQASVTGSTRAIIITKTGTAMAVTPAAIYLSASPTSITTNGISTTTISVTAVNTLNASISGIEVTMSSVGPDHGILSAATVTTPGTVNFSSGANKANRTATVTGTSGSVIGQTPVQIIGSTVTVTADTSSISAPTPATSTNLTVAVKDAGGNAISGAAVTVTQSSSDGGSITFGPSATTYIAGTADANGVFTTTAMGLTQGKVTVTATWLGTPGTTTLTVTATGAAFGIEGQYLDGSTTAISGNPHPTAMTINPSGTPYSPHSLKILVNAPGVTTVRFSTTIGEWDSTGNKVTDVAVGSTGDGTGKVSATLTSTYIGVANVQVSDVAHPAIKDNLTVGMGSGEPPNKILLQAAPTVVPVNGGSSTVTATVYDASNNPLGGQPVAFSIVDGTSTSGGETLSDVVLTTATVASGNLSVGQASTSFTSGSMPSSGTGVKIRASVVNTAVQTGTSPSGNDVGILIGGVAGSIAFGQDSKAKEDSSGGNYEFKMSVLVADANGNPVNRAVVNLGVWPIAWCTGAACVCDTDTATTGTFYNEDKNENLILDAGEDGNRIYYYGTFPDATGTADTLITPTNSAGGTVPATVETGTNGVAAFTLTYPKSSARWIYDRIRATTIVQGTETRAEIILHLNVVAGDESVCNESPFKY